ncbi:SusE domain-containing protein [Mucilaginibacter sp. FT3.2]|uniref:SusE domain-containing protein n=1 Tax=Mucilaginibacter sp. FT3.2 TaxID=2723090 RepID=UPI00161858B8|nr:SusE domain-containing protein [Mucilaginibacter sp. FT3.2]MBB6234905.1 hypothetical protein [Mucilaginibacter sp. FT3.2]
MKKLFTKFLAFGGIGLLMLASCKKDDSNKVVALVSTAKGTLTASTTTPALSKAHLTDDAITFNIKSPNYGFNAGVSNTIQISTTADFATVKEASLNVKDVSKIFNVADFNNLLLALNLPGGISTTVQVRLKTQITGSPVAPTYSNVVTLTVTPFNLQASIYLAGAYEGWAVPSVNVDSLVSQTGNGIYIGIINFTAGNLEFKILPGNKNYDGNYGADGAGKITQGTGNPPNLAAPLAGLTFITVDINAKTIVYTPVTYYYSAIGDATPGVAWNTDTDLKYDNGNEAWVGNIPFTIGGFKVRRNHDWGISYGTVATPDGVSLTSASGGNIPITAAGTYSFSFKLNATVGKTAADNNNTSATYTLVKK